MKSHWYNIYDKTFRYNGTEVCNKHAKSFHTTNKIIGYSYYVFDGQPIRISITYPKAKQYEPEHTQLAEGNSEDESLQYSDSEEDNERCNKPIEQPIPVQYCNYTSGKENVLISTYYKDNMTMKESEDLVALLNDEIRMPRKMYSFTDNIIIKDAATGYILYNTESDKFKYGRLLVVPGHVEEVPELLIAWYVCDRISEDIMLYDINMRRIAWRKLFGSVTHNLVHYTRTSRYINLGEDDNYQEGFVEEYRDWEYGSKEKFAMFPISLL